MQLRTVLRDARARAGLSLRDVERRAGISNGYLSLIESGQARKPSPRYLHALADTYGVSYSLLMELAGHVAPTSLPDSTGMNAEGLGDLSDTELQQVRAFASFLRASRFSESRPDKSQP